jgi:hypothetical protein
MRNVEQTLKAWQTSLCTKVDIGGLIARNRIAHKWKATYRSLSLREGVAWRTQDLLGQSVLLHDAQHAVGARILLRSAFESVAVLIYLNQLTRQVLAGTLNFHEFSEKTATLLLGSRDKSTDHTALNIATVLQKCKARYPDIEQLYGALSESAHPNYEGTSVGYSTVDRENYVTTFSNKWDHMYGKNHINLVGLCMEVFDAEYNHEWVDAFEKLESWLVENDATLEATKNDRGV